MRKAATGLGALVVSLATAMGPAMAQQKPLVPSGARHGTVALAPRTAAAPLPGFAKAGGQGTAASRHASGRVKGTHAKAQGSHAKKIHSRTVQAHIRSKADDAGGPRSVLQFHGGAAGLFAGWPFTRPGSPGRFGSDHGKHQYGGFIGWFGPVFWPYAYDDIFAYVFWPFDSSDYGETFWEFAFDDLFEGIFWTDVEPETDQGEIVAADETDIPSSGDRRRAGALGLDGQSREFAQICGDRRPGLSQWPILRIAQSVGLTREQRTALKDLQTAAAAAARVLKSACPVEAPTTSVGRLDAMEERVQAMLHAVDLVRPALERFFDLLSDAQKARFATVPLAWLTETGADPARLNPRGGAIALGHPLGASGARLMTTLVHHMRDNGIRYGLQTMCEGGGMANATVLELM